ncbi:MAG: ACP S-malonyltransferase [Planctomycetota bacterium]
MADDVVLLCPGQGAQSVGMGKAWADASPEARAIFERADAVLAADDVWNETAALSSLCFDGPADTLNKTNVAQPALYTAAIASWHGWCAAEGWDPASAPIAAAAGLSLGEYTALHLAGAFDFETGLSLVALRGRAMQDAAEASASGMVALIGADEASAQALCDAVLEGHPEDVLVVANLNAPGQVVISGSKAACDRAVEAASDHSLKATPLSVAGAFHSPLMAPAAERLAAKLVDTQIAQPRCPVLANVAGTPHAPTDPADSGTIGETIRLRLVEQLTGSVRWADNLRWILDNVSAPLHELAPGKTLAGILRRIERSAKAVSHDAPN